LWATAAVVPEPKKKSKTISPGLVDIFKILSIRASGFCPSKFCASCACEFITNISVHKLSIG